MNRRRYRRRMARVDWRKKGACPVWRTRHDFGRIFGRIHAIAAMFGLGRHRSDWRYPS